MKTHSFTTSLQLEKSRSSRFPAVPVMKVKMPPKQTGNLIFFSSVAVLVSCNSIAAAIIFCFYFLLFLLFVLLFFRRVAGHVLQIDVNFK